MYINYFILSFSFYVFVIHMASPFITTSNPLRSFSVIIHSPSTFCRLSFVIHMASPFITTSNPLRSFSVIIHSPNTFCCLSFCYTHGSAIYNHLKSASLLFGDYTFAKHFLLFLQAKSRKCLAHCV